MKSTYMAKKEEMGNKWERQWYIVNAEDEVLGRLATKIAKVLQGKHKPIYTPHVDTGDYVVVVNAGKIRTTGNKLEEKIYYRYSGYPGGMREVNLDHMLKENPTMPIKMAVKRMLPTNNLGRKMIKKLKIYPNEDHPHGDRELNTLDL